MVISHQIRYGIWALVSLLLVGLVWLGIGQYLADSRALAAVTPATVSAPPQAAVPAPVPVTEPVVKEKPPAELVVHVAGAVAKPGVYRLAEGARVFDAIAAAGGANADAVVDSLNLAELVSDQQKISVPTKAQVETGAWQPVAAKPSAPSSAPAATQAGGKLKLNQATEAQLRAIGLTAPAAKAVVEHIKKNGPVRTWEQVDAISGVGEKTLATLKSQTQL